MRFRPVSRAGALVVLLGCAGGPAFAQSAQDEKGFYLGAIAGAASYPAAPEIIVGPYTFYSTDTREDDMAWGVTAGYRFGRYFAMEAGYVDLGEATASMVESTGRDVRTDLFFSARGATLAAVGFFPFRKWEPFLKAGVLFQKAELRLNGTEFGTPFSLRGEATGGTKAFFDTGVNYRFNEKWKATLGIAFFVDVGEENRTGEADIKLTYLGISYQF
jgi:OmpA-OmpF porin, OOP family